MSEKFEGAIVNKHYGNGVTLSKKDRQQGSTFDVSADRELMRLPAMKGKLQADISVAECGSKCK